MWLTEAALRDNRDLLCRQKEMNIEIRSTGSFKVTSSGEIIITIPGTWENNIWEIPINKLDILKINLLSKPCDRSKSAFPKFLHLGNFDEELNFDDFVTVPNSN